MRVLSPWALLGVTMAVMATLYLLFPRQSLMDTVQREAGNDELTADYIAALLRTEPANFDLRMLLAEKRHALGQTGLAREAMEPVILTSDPALRRRVLLLEYRILETEAGTPDPGNSAGSASQAQLRERLKRYLAEDWPPQQLLEFARKARARRMTDMAAAFSQRLEQSRALIPPHWLAEAAQEALADGDYVQSARLYFSAQKRAAAREDKRGYFLKGLGTLRSGNLLRQALEAADAEIGDLHDDEETLAYLTRLALAAGDPKRAQTYVKRLLHLSGPAVPRGAWVMLDGVLAVLDGALLALDSTLTVLAGHAHAAEAGAHAAEAGAGAAQSPAPSSMRPYDEQFYTLAFDVFLANGNVADAYRVAEAAVAQRPQDATWRRRLAQVAEWSGKPVEALRQWRHLAERGGGDEAWSAVLRLAPGLHDDEALLAAWNREATRRTLKREEWKNLAAIYESLGRPADGIAWLKTRYEQHPDLAILEVVTDLEERSGRIDDAIATLRRILRLEPDASNPAHAMRLATLLFLRSDFAGAYQVLQGMQARVAANHPAYWKLLADLAWQLQDDATAGLAYGRLQASGSAVSSDLERLVALLRPQHPEDARRMAVFSWRKFRSLSGFMLALELANEQRDFAAMKTLLDEVRPDEEAKLSGNGFYFVLRAGYHQAAGDRPAAMAQYRLAMRANPSNADLQLSYLWLLIDARQDKDSRKELVERLRAWRGREGRGWWDAYAAAYLSMGEPKRALPFMSRQAVARAEDYLWLANYAETLEEAGHTGMAARVRRHAWMRARQAVSTNALKNPSGDAPKAAPGEAAQAAEADFASAASAAQSREHMLAYARLALRQAPGDGSLNAMRRLLRQDKPPPDPALAGPAGAAAAPAAEQTLDKAVAELVLAWTLGEERLEAARQWMWSRFARRVDSPAWADIGLALAERDKLRLAEILDEKGPEGREWPAASRIDAARELGRTGLAAMLGFEAQTRQPGNDDIHLRLATDLLASAHSVIAKDVMFQRGVLQGHEQSARLQVWAMPRLRLSVALDRVSQHSADGSQLTGVPGSDRSLAVSALWRHERGETEVTLASRTGMASFAALRLAHSRPLDERMTATFALAWRERAGESIALGISGHKDEASATLNYRASGREYLSGRVWDARFHTQQQTYLGLGRGLSAEAGYRIRSEYPDFNVRVSRVISHFQTADGAITDVAANLIPGGAGTTTASFFMPQSFRLWAINAGFGREIREQRSRAIRPFADVGRTVSSTSGSGYNWLLGAGGSVLGPDHLALYWMRAKGGGLGAAVLELGLRYQLYFD